MPPSFKKILIFLSLLPIGISSVIGTIFLTNTNKPAVEKIEVLDIDDEEPEEEEEIEISPFAKITKYSSKSEGGVTPAPVIIENEETSDEEEEEQEEEDVLEEEEVSPSPETNNETGEPQQVDPKMIIKKVIEKINNMNIKNASGDLYGLFSINSDLRKLGTAIKKIQKSKGNNETIVEDE